MQHRLYRTKGVDLVKKEIIFYEDTYIWIVSCFFVVVLFPFFAWATIASFYSFLWLHEVPWFFAPVFLTMWILCIKHYPEFSRGLDRLHIREDCVEWKCLFYRTRRILFKDCCDIGVETFNNIKNRRMPIRGDENAQVYFSADPYPDNMRGRITQIPCSECFIRFRYTDELARTLLEVLPEDKKPAIQAFYNQMQNRDYERQKAIRAWKNSRARRKREKERRKQKKG